MMFINARKQLEVSKSDQIQYYFHWSIKIEGDLLFKSISLINALLFVLFFFIINNEKINSLKSDANIHSDL